MKKDNPRIYAYTIEHRDYKGWIKVGETIRTVEERVKEQHAQTRKGKNLAEILLDESRKRKDGSVFTDREVHEHLVNKGFKKDGEWIKCTLDDAIAAIIAVRTRTTNKDNRTKYFGMRPEQKQAVEMTAEYFRNCDDLREPKFLWNAKMRFGKTFTSYQLAKEMGWKNILILTFKPAAESAWKDDATKHIDFDGWQYISQNEGRKIRQLDQNEPIVCFGSFQYHLRDDESEMRKWVQNRDWDCVIFDEYHFGAWRERAKSLTEDDSDSDADMDYKEVQPDDFDVSDIQIKASYFLYLSGTPFRAITSGEFTKENIYNWSYNDEQQAKENWAQDPKSPYKNLPQMHLLTYQLPKKIREVAMEEEFNEFNLNGFFKTGEDGKFIKEKYVKDWLRLIREGEPVTTENATKELKIDKDNPSDNEYKGRDYIDILNSLSHTLWFLPSIASCIAMKKLLDNDSLFKEYEAVLVAGEYGGNGAEAKKPVIEAMERDDKSPLETKTITLTCGKLTTGVTLEPLSGVFMLRNLKSPETYFQTAFRAQNQFEGKEDCYVIDFAPNRALKQIVNYVEKAVNNTGARKSETDSVKEGLEEFIKFLPVISYKGGRMENLNAKNINDIALVGTTDKYITKVWRNSDLINLGKSVIENIMDNPEAMAAIEKIEALVKDSGSSSNSINVIINKTKEIKDMRAKGRPKKEISAEEKKLRDAKKLIEEKIKKFVERIPVFMYLTDHREEDLKDVINKLDTDLFKKVTGIDKKEFKILTDVGVFNKTMMDTAIGEFKKYEDNSFEYIGKKAHIKE